VFAPMARWRPKSRSTGNGLRNMSSPGMLKKRWLA
jgi:hypothetical protein